MAAPFIRRRAAIMCHYPWAMIFLPLPTVVVSGVVVFFFFLSSNTRIFIVQKKPQPTTNNGVMFPCKGIKGERSKANSK